MTIPPSFTSRLSLLLFFLNNIHPSTPTVCGVCGVCVCPTIAGHPCTLAKLPRGGLYLATDARHFKSPESLLD
ncbi:hypothetical protein BKA65DRAFT_499249 [Rhexocercosporidium sp. MPI-PUGE-AT-0058]|nr:hypothetical protein BKA65DRAFT_499249 [Rhexocercosporidium sp. MPI-PUGE-AT-0058]